MRHLLLIAALAGPAYAETCPVAQDYSAEIETLFEQARNAPNERVARGAADGLWQIYLRAPDDKAQAVLDRGMARRGGYDYFGAKIDFDLLIEYCPDYAEGWNQRAYTFYLQGEFDKALADLDAALERSPAHIGAQSGRALTLMQLGRIDQARAQMLAALENNPWLSERALVAKGAPLGPKGEDI